MLTAASAFISNHFIAPTLFAFLGLIPIVILLYILKLRRTAIIIPSTMLWIKSLQDLTANAPFQRLRKNLLLFLQILMLLLLITALARPFVRAEGIRGRNLCLLIDHSASMQTLEEGKTRLQLAKVIALEMANEMSAGDKMMIVAFADGAHVLCELTDDKFRLRTAINSIVADDTKTAIRDAMQIVRSLGAGNAEVPEALSAPSGVPGAASDLEVVLLSDGRIADTNELGASLTNFAYRQIGSRADNAGIVAFSLRKGEGGREHQTFVLVHNAGAEKLDTTLSLYFDDTLMAVDELQIPPGESGEVVFAHPDLGTGVLRAELDLEDALTVDNKAWLTLRPTAKVNVLLIGEADSASTFFLKRALILEPRVKLSEATPANYAPSDEYDLTIFDGFAPETLPPNMTVFFNIVPEVLGLTAEGEIENPPVLAKDADHPVMRFLNPGNIGIQKAFKITLPPGGRALLSTTGSPLIADLSQGDNQILVVAFDIAQSDWPLQLSFPLFVQNLVAWSPRAASAGEMDSSTGTPLTLMPHPEHDHADVTTPSGKTERIDLDPLRPSFFGATQKAGLYTVSYGDMKETFAVNLLDRNESSIKPADSLALGKGEVAAQHGRIKQNRELWRWFILGAVMVLSLEWWIYSRRAWI